MKICCVFSSESPEGGNSNEYTQHNLSIYNRKPPEIIPHTIMPAAMGVLSVRDSRTNSK